MRLGGKDKDASKTTVKRKDPLSITLPSLYAQANAPKLTTRDESTSSLPLIESASKSEELVCPGAPIVKIRKRISL